MLSFKNAFEGILWIAKNETNFRIHIILSILGIAGGVFFQISYFEFLTILILIGLGLSIEAVNTAIEETIDAIHKDFSPAIKIAKDVSAAAMLIFAITAFSIACIIFIPRIIALFTYKF